MQKVTWDQFFECLFFIEDYMKAYRSAVARETGIVNAAINRVSKQIGAAMRGGRECGNLLEKRKDLDLFLEFAKRGCCAEILLSDIEEGVYG